MGGSPPSARRRNEIALAGALAGALLIAAILPALAQAPRAVAGRDGPSVYVDESVIDSLGPPTTLPDVLRNEGREESSRPVRLHPPRGERSATPSASAQGSKKSTAQAGTKSGTQQSRNKQSVNKQSGKKTAAKPESKKSAAASANMKSSRPALQQQASAPSGMPAQPPPAPAPPPAGGQGTQVANAGSNPQLRGPTGEEANASRQAPSPAPAPAPAAAPAPSPAPAPAPAAAPTPAPAAAAAPPPTPASSPATPPRSASNTPPPPPPAATPPQTASLPPEGGLPTRILVPANVSDLPDQAKAPLDAVAKVMKADAQLRVQLMAYANGPADQANQARRISLARAIAVRSYLIEQGISSTRIDVRALGNRSESGGPLDRVDVVAVER